MYYHASRTPRNRVNVLLVLLLSSERRLCFASHAFVLFAHVRLNTAVSRCHDLLCSASNAHILCHFPLLPCFLFTGRPCFASVVMITRLTVFFEILTLSSFFISTTQPSVAAVSVVTVVRCAIASATDSARKLRKILVHSLPHGTFRALPETPLDQVIQGSCVNAGKGKCC